MLNFFDIDIKRIVVHTLYAKEEGNEHSMISSDNRLTDVTENVKSLLIERLSKAAAKTSKAFELEIDDYYEGSFFSIAKDLYKTDNDEFISKSVQIAQLLAQAQTRNTLPGGYVLIVEAKSKFDKSVVIVIKAELNTVLQYYSENDKSVLKMLDDVFLSPSQKFFKIGVIYEKEEDNEFFSYPNNKYGCFLFDDQFKPDSRPAEYFYREFLGFSIDTNPKIQSKRFFDITDKFIRKTVPNPEFKDEMLNVLKHEFLTNDENEVKPTDFADMYFPEEEMREGYKNQVTNYLPKNIIKDPSLIETKLNKKKINFPNKITIAGPSNIFDYNVKIIKNTDDINDEELKNEDVTVLKIIGKPYQDQ